MCFVNQHAGLEDVHWNRGLDTDEILPAVPYLVAILHETDLTGAQTALRAISGQTEFEKPHEFRM